MNLLQNSNFNNKLNDNTFYMFLSCKVNTVNMFYSSRKHESSMGEVFFKDLRCSLRQICNSQVLLFLLKGDDMVPLLQALSVCVCARSSSSEPKFISIMYGSRKLRRKPGV